MIPGARVASPRPRYPDGPEQMCRERLAAALNSAKVVAMDAQREAGAA